MATPHAHPPEVTVPPGCEIVELPLNIGSGRSIFAGLEGPERMRLRMFKRTSDGHLVGKAWFGNGAEGPPRNVHGGAVAYVLDEAMGAVGWMNDLPVVAAKISFEFLKMSPLLVDFDIQARVTKSDSRRIHVEAELILPGGVVCVRAQGVFAVLTPKKLQALDAAKFDPQGLLKNPKFKWAKDDAR